ncbi:hypothetical protein SM021_002314 [Cronobacter muytjensii]|nr:hypothetical protein [Cronobacter muytjensii]
MNLPEKEYLTIHEVAKKLNCEVRDVLHLGVTNRIKISNYASCDAIRDNCNIEIEILDTRPYQDPNVDKAEIESLDKIFNKYSKRNIIRVDDLILKGLKLISEPAQDDLNYTYTFSAQGVEGFWFSEIESLRNLELSNITFEHNPECTFETLYSRSSKILLIVSFDNACSVRFSNFVVFMDDYLDFIEHRLNSKPLKKESPKTANKKGEIIPSLITLIPEFRGVDLESLPVSKVINMLEALTSRRGISLPPTDKNTWSRYLGRK